MQDIRLDFITNINPEYITAMTTLRKQFIKLDEQLSQFGDIDDAKKDGVQRCLSIARTHIETACQYAIKALCLCGETK